MNTFQVTINRSPTISFDFDETLFDYDSRLGFIPIHTNIELLRSYHALGCRIIIITARLNTCEDKREIEQSLSDCNILHCIDKIIFVEDELKGKFASREYVVLHYDDNDEQLEDVESYGIKTINSLIGV